MKPKDINVQFNDVADKQPIGFGNYTNHILAEGDSWFAWSQLSFCSFL